MRPRQRASRSAPTRNGTASPMLIRPHGVPVADAAQHVPAEQEMRERGGDRERRPEARPAGVPHQREGAGGIEAAEQDRSQAKRSASQPVPDTPTWCPTTGERRERQERRQHRDILEARRPAAEHIEAGAVRRERQPAGALLALVLDDDGDQQRRR